MRLAYEIFQAWNATSTQSPSQVRKEQVSIIAVSMTNHTTLELTSSTGYCSVPYLYRNILCLVKWGIEILIGLDAEKREH